MNQAKFIAAMHRSSSGKPPLVADRGRTHRRRPWPRLKRLAVRLIVRLCGQPLLTKIKWRWGRGEIRERRLHTIRLGEALAAPIRRRIDYIAASKKLCDVQPLQNQDEPANAPEKP